MTTREKATESKRLYAAGSQYTPRFTVNALDVIDAYLAEHQADDDEPITDEWLAAAGGVFEDNPSPRVNGFVFVVQPETAEQPGYLLRLIEGNCPAELRNTWRGGWEHGVGLPMQRTRGDFRRLCEALGVELKAPTPQPA